MRSRTLQIYNHHHLSRDLAMRVFWNKFYLHVLREIPNELHSNEIIIFCILFHGLATSVRRSTDGRLRRPRLLVGLDIALFRQVCLVGKGRLGRYTTTYIHDTLGIAGGNPRIPLCTKPRPLWTLRSLAHQGTCQDSYSHGLFGTCPASLPPVTWVAIQLPAYSRILWYT